MSEARHGESRARLEILTATLLAALLAFHSIGKQSLWLDEAFSVALARHEWSRLWRILVTDQANMAPYHILLHWWLRLGSSEAIVRSLSALMVVATVLPLFSLARRLFDHTTATLAALLFAINAFVIAHGAQEARGNALAILLITTSSYFFVRGITQRVAGHWFAYSLTTVLAVYAHLFALWVVAGQCLSALLLPDPWTRRRDLWMSQAGIALLISPLLIPIFTTDHLWWVRTPSLTTVVQVAADLAGRGGTPLLVAYVLACGYGLVPEPATQGSDDWRIAWGRWFVASWGLVPVLGSLAFSILVKPILISRYLLVAVPALALLAACGIRKLRPAWLGGLAFLALVLLSGRALLHWYGGRYAKENWRGATWYVLRNALADDGVAFEAPYIRFAFEYYVEHRPPGSVVPKPLFPTMAWDSGNHDYSGRLDEWLRDHPLTNRRVWLVVSHEPGFGSSAQPWLSPELERSACRVLSRRFTGVRIHLYQLGPCLDLPNGGSKER
jgi:mannosyltransferase